MARLHAIRGCCIGAIAAAAALAAPARAQQPTVLVLGDSLAVGLQPFLPALLPGRAVTFATQQGWTSPMGMKVLRRTLRLGAAPRTVVISLGTNDGPSPQVFRDRVRRTLGYVHASYCVVWPAIYRPRRKGSYRELNRVLRAEARRDRRLVVIPWDRAVRKRAVALPDGLHPNSAGFRWRSYLIAAAVGRC